MSSRLVRDVHAGASDEREPADLDADLGADDDLRTADEARRAPGSNRAATRGRRRPPSRQDTDALPLQGDVGVRTQPPDLVEALERAAGGARVVSGRGARCGGARRGDDRRHDEREERPWQSAVRGAPATVIPAAAPGPRTRSGAARRAAASCRRRRAARTGCSSRPSMRATKARSGHGSRSSAMTDLSSRSTRRTVDGA